MLTDDYTNAEKVIYQIGGDECGITSPNTEEHIIYTGRLYAKSGSANDVISREKLIDMELTCDFDRELTVSVDQIFTPIVRKSLIKDNEQKVLVAF